MPTPRRVAPSALGTAFLLAAVVGSGIMARAARGRKRRARAALQYAADRRHPGRADPDRSARSPGAHFNPAVSARLRAARRIAVARRRPPTSPRRLSARIVGRAGQRI